MCLIIYLYFVFRCPIDNGTPVFMMFISGGQQEIDFLKEVHWSAYIIRQTSFTTVIFIKIKRYMYIVYIIMQYISYNAIVLFM